ncbi:hypothetical protein VTJ04DRAFT_7747 [Mycothermus thermophilus]|uniref:uncharacterized protein n=1 Tax=Humicola insolens TaxID=85995 RepID=UPI0037441366
MPADGQDGQDGNPEWEMHVRLDFPFPPVTSARQLGLEPWIGLAMSRTSGCPAPAPQHPNAEERPSPDWSTPAMEWAIPNCQQAGPDDDG